MLLGYMKTLTLHPCTIKPKSQINKTDPQTITPTESPKSQRAYHGLGWKIGGELGANDTSVTMRPRDLSPNATVVAAVLLYLSLVNVSQTLPGVPGHLLLGVDVLDLNQGRVWVLVRLRPAQNPNSISKQPLISQSETNK